MCAVLSQHRLQAPRGEGGHGDMVFLVGAMVGRLSTLAGCARTCSREASAAAVTCAIMKPEFSPASAREERRQARHTGVDQHGDAALGDGADLGNRHGHAHRRPGPPARRGSCRRTAAAPCSANTSGLSVTALASRSSTSGGVAQLVQAGAHHLRLAAQAVGVLHAVVAFQVRGADRRCPPAARGSTAAHVDLARAGRARRGCAGRTGRRCRGRRPASAHRHHQRGFEHRAQMAQQRVQRQGGRRLGAVDQRQALLGAQSCSGAMPAACRPGAGRACAGRRCSMLAFAQQGQASCAPAAPDRPKRRPSPGRAHDRH